MNKLKRFFSNKTPQNKIDISKNLEMHLKIRGV